MPAVSLIVQPRMTTHADTQNDLQDLEAQFRSERRALAEAQDLLFREARTANTFTDEPVSEEQVRAIYDLAKWAPTSMNNQPLRIVLVRSPEARWSPRRDHGRRQQGQDLDRPARRPSSPPTWRSTTSSPGRSRTSRAPATCSPATTPCAPRARHAQRHPAGGLLHPRPSAPPAWPAPMTGPDALRRSTASSSPTARHRSSRWSTSAAGRVALDRPPAPPRRTTRLFTPVETYPVGRKSRTVQPLRQSVFQLHGG